MSVLGCKVASLPIKYLGLPLGASYKALLFRMTLLRKWKIGWWGWKRLYLSEIG